MTDTFQLYEQEKDMVANLLPDNSNRRKNQRKQNITVIIGNPPYSSGQKSENDDAENVKYHNLDQRISDTFVENSSNAMGKSKLYDSYIRAFRWASDRIGNDGVVAFVTGSGWLEKSFADGIRKQFHSEFSSIYIVNLRGDIRKNMLTKGAAKEGDNVFGSGSMTGISIAILCRKKSDAHCRIYYFDIGLDKKIKEKLALLRLIKSVKSGQSENLFELITPDANGDWINQGEKDFSKYIVTSDKKGIERNKIFHTHSIGVLSNRDMWVYNFSKTKLRENISSAIDFYNSEIERLQGRGIKNTEQAKKNY